MQQLVTGGTNSTSSNITHIPYIVPVNNHTIASNPFLLALWNSHQSIYESILAQDWIVLLPPPELFAATTELSFSKDFISTHIIKKAISDLVHVTLNDKHIILDETSIITEEGFPFETSVEIIHDSRHVNSAGRSFTIFHIDKPLIPLDSSASPVSDSSVSNFVLDDKSLILLLRSIPSGDRTIDFMMERITLFNDIAILMETVETIQEDIQKLLNDCFNILSSHGEQALLPLLNQKNISWDMLFQLVETFVMEHTYEIVFYKITASYRARDLAIMDIVSQCQHLDLCQMGLPPQFGPSLLEASKIFQEVAVLRTPHEKIKCLSHSIQALSQTSSTNTNSSNASTLVLTSDYLVPLLILIIIRSNPLNMHSNFVYMKSFSFEFDVDSGEYGYILSSLEAVLQYIENSHDHMVDQSNRCIKFLNAARASDLDTLKHYLESASPDSDDVIPTGRGSQHSVTATPRRIIDCRDWEGKNALVTACRYSQTAAIKILLEHGLDSNQPDYIGNTPLHYCAKFNLTESAHLLISKGADTTTRNNLGQTPLFLAVAASSDDMIDLLAFPKKVLNIPTSSGDTVLHCALTAQMVAKLMDLGANPNIKNNNGLTPILFHCHIGQSNIAQVFIEKAKVPGITVDLTCHDLHRRNIIHICALRGSLGIVQLILSLSKNVSPETNIAAEQVETVPAQKRCFAIDLNFQTLRGNTPLHLACLSGELEIVSELLHAGADPTRRNFTNKHAADLTQNDDIRSLIEDYSLFFKPPPQGEKLVAKVVRAQLIDSGILFFIKSGQYQDFNTIQTVVRTLSDFGLIRSQLLVEHPEIGVPDMRELFSNPAWVYENVKSGPSSRFLKKIVRRLDKFLTYLIRHNVFSHHELTTEFLVVAELEPDMMYARSHSKLDYIGDSVRSCYYPYVEDLVQKSIKFEEEGSRLMALHSLVREVGIKVRNVGKARKVLGFQLRVLRHHLSEPGVTFFKDKLYITETFCKSAKLILDQSTAEIQETGDFFLECVYELSGSRQGLLHYHHISEEYVELVQQLDTIHTTMERLQTQASKFGSEDTVQKLSETYYEHSKMAMVVENKACYLNHVTKSLSDDVEWFQSVGFTLVSKRSSNLTNIVIICTIYECV
ncbi:hypothetical protein MT418_000722 [Batrachochytrium dendrobatidis]